MCHREHRHWMSKWIFSAYFLPTVLAFMPWDLPILISVSLAPKKLPVSSLLATDSCSVSQLLGSCLWIRKYPPKKRHRAQQTPCDTFLFGSLGQLSPTILGNSQMTSKRSFFVCIFSSLCSWWIVYWIWVCK